MHSPAAGRARRPGILTLSPPGVAYEQNVVEPLSESTPSWSCVTCGVACMRSCALRMMSNCPPSQWFIQTESEAECMPCTSSQAQVQKLIDSASARAHQLGILPAHLNKCAVS
jgi:hypothetical protein